MKLTTIYTKKGDAGTTSLVGGIRTTKDSARLEAYGTADELSSNLGMLYSLIAKEAGHNADNELPRIGNAIEHIQNVLFNVCTYLATDTSQTPVYSSAKLDAEEITSLEKQIDTINSSLPQLNSFILPGGNILASQCHICRTICRRTERRIVTLVSTLSEENKSGFNPDILRYMNRLSDYLFVLARKLNFLCNTEEKIWENTCK